MAPLLTLSFELGSLAAQSAEEACLSAGAVAVSFADARDDPVYHPAKSGMTLAASSSPLVKTPDFVGTPVLEPLPGEMRLWPTTRVTALFVGPQDARALAASLGAALGLDPALIQALPLAERAWEREWLKDFHALRFGERLWVCPRHERVSTPGAIVVTLDPGLAFGTGTHPSTALCLEYLDAHLVPGACVIDYGCGSGVLALACAKLGAAQVHCFDIDPQALIATRENAEANGVSAVVRVHPRADRLPRQADLLLANILSGPLCALAPSFAALVRPGGDVVLAGLMQHEAGEVTGAYAACFDVARFGEREEWVGLCGLRR